MAGLTLVIGNRNYSAWSMAAWVLLRQFGIGFEEVLIRLNVNGSLERKLSYSPAGRVPVLLDGDLRIWDSLAIVERIAERFPEKALWPEDGRARALARSVTAEMHAGFGAMRTRMPFNCRGRADGTVRDPEVLAEVDRVREIWRECRAAHGGDGAFLFGGFTAADAMFATVVSRFQTYGVALEGVEASYAESILGLSSVQEWMEDAGREPWEVPLFDGALSGPRPPRA
jgi:glutathione S-transferase